MTSSVFNDLTFVWLGRDLSAKLKPIVGKNLKLGQSRGPTTILKRISTRINRETFYMDPNKFCVNLYIKKIKLNTIQ